MPTPISFDEDTQQLFMELVKALDRLGLNNLNASGPPGTGEALAMNVREGLGSIADAINNLAEAVRESSATDR